MPTPLPSYLADATTDDARATSPFQRAPHWTHGAAWLPACSLVFGRRPRRATRSAPLTSDLPPRGRTNHHVHRHQRTDAPSAPLKKPVTDVGGSAVGRLVDIIVGLHGGSYPLVTGLVVHTADNNVFVSVAEIAALRPDHIVQRGDRLVAPAF